MPKLDPSPPDSSDRDPSPHGSTPSLNFRDLGGHPTPDGRVRYAQVYRSDSLSHCDADSVAHLVGTLGIRTVIDLRYDDEVTSSPLDALSSAGVEVHHVPIIDPARPDWQPMDDFEWMGARYEYVLETGGPHLVSALRVIARHSSRPLVFQCTAGKDRTGLLAALLLGLLGVDHQTIVTDYVRTSDALPAMIQRWEARGASFDDERIRRFVTADAANIEHALAAIESRHGSIEQYARDHGFTERELASLRDALVEPGA